MSDNRFFKVQRKKSIFEKFLSLSIGLKISLCVCVLLFLMFWGVFRDTGAIVIGLSLFGLIIYKFFKDSATPGDVYRNPSNNYTEEISALAWFWVLIFGIFYFLFKGVTRHFFLSLFFNVMTLGFAWFIYPFFVKSIIRNHYLRQGWIEEQTY